MIESGRLFALIAVWVKDQDLAVRCATTMKSEDAHTDELYGSRMTSRHTREIFLLRCLHGLSHDKEKYKNV